MFICVTHVDAQSGIPCTEAPMSTGPAFPKVKGLKIEWADQTNWPTDKPLFYGTCDDDADTNALGIISTMDEHRYAMLRNVETANQKLHVRNQRDFKLRSDVDSLNPIRWGELTDDQKVAWAEYRKLLLDVPQQAGFPWSIEWPKQP